MSNQRQENSRPRDGKRPEGETAVRIREVEERVGITKKNIRFYEEQGLLKPEREAGNGYREYTQADVDTLMRIKLLRSLNVPISEIRRVQTGSLTLSDCMKRHRVSLEREKDNLDQVCEITDMLDRAGGTFDNLEVGTYFDAMAEMEKKGTRFMDVRKNDRRERRRSAIWSSAIMILLMAAIMAFIIWGYIMEPIPIGILVILLVIPLAVIVGVAVSLKERMTEIKGGEEDEACKY